MYQLFVRVYSVADSLLGAMSKSSNSNDLRAELAELVKRKSDTAVSFPIRDNSIVIAQNQHHFQLCLQYRRGVSNVSKYIELHYNVCIIT